MVCVRAYAYAMISPPRGPRWLRPTELLLAATCVALAWSLRLRVAEVAAKRTEIQALHRRRRRLQQLQTSGCTAVTSSPEGLIAPVQVASVDEHGALFVPRTTKEIFIEIGCSDRDTMDERELPASPNAFLIAFEPMIDKYAVLLARGSSRYFNKGGTDRAVPVGFHHKRGVVLPLAVSPAGGMLSFNVAQTAGCSSLAKLSPHGRWGSICRASLERRRVPSITLTAALRLAGAVKGALPVSKLKIDAQGVDFDLINSTDPALLRSRVVTIELEVRATSSRCGPLYHGQPGCDEVVEHMRRIGFIATDLCPAPGGRRSDEGTSCERSILFRRKTPQSARGGGGEEGADTTDALSATRREEASAPVVEVPPSRRVDLGLRDPPRRCSTHRGRPRACLASKVCNISPPAVIGWCRLCRYAQESGACTAGNWST